MALLLVQNNKAHYTLAHENPHALEDTIVGTMGFFVLFLPVFAKPNLYLSQNYNDWFYLRARAPYALLPVDQHCMNEFLLRYYTNLHIYLFRLD